MPESLASPCVSVCRMDESRGLCSGCLRSLEEIAAWSAMGDEARRAVMRLLPQRRRAWLRQNTAQGPSEDAA